MDGLRWFRADVPALLEPGEVPGAWETVAYVHGAERFGPKPRFDPFGSFTDVVMGLPTEYVTDLADRMVSGISLVGWTGCAAVELREAVERAPGSADLMVTDRRILVTTRSRRTDVLRSWPRSFLRSVTRRPRLVQRGRIMLVHADGSALALMTGIVSASPAQRLEAAVARTTPPPVGG
jgi:hypothetical protein